jgi:Domain of unknown function (DUF4279)
MNRYRYKISLRVRHPSMDPAEITYSLRFNPSQFWSAGERRASPSDGPLEGVWPDTYWTARVVEGEWPGKDLEAAIAELADRLETNKGFFERVRSDGGTVELFVGWFFDGQSGGVFDFGLLARMADLKINLSLDLHPPDTPVTLPIYRSIELPDGTGRILLFDGAAGSKGRLENLICVDHSGQLIWTAHLPKNTGPDAFVSASLSVKLDGPVVIAHTWSCFALTIDPKTGETLSCAFTK